MLQLVFADKNVSYETFINDLANALAPKLHHQSEQGIQAVRSGECPSMEAERDVEACQQASGEDRVPYLRSPSPAAASTGLFRLGVYHIESFKHKVYG